MCRLGTTIDDAVGEAFDKVGEAAGPGLSRRPAGRARGARRAMPARFALPRPHAGPAEPRFLLLRPQDRGAAARPRRIAPLGRDATSPISAPRFRRRSSIPRRPPPRRRCALPRALGRRAGAGGRRRRRRQCGDPPRACALLRRNGLGFVAPPPALCTDNGAMIAWAGHRAAAARPRRRPDFAARPRWPLDARRASRASRQSLKRTRWRRYTHIAVLGAGAWGTALANLAARDGPRSCSGRAIPHHVAAMTATGSMRGSCPACPLPADRRPDRRRLPMSPAPSVILSPCRRRRCARPVSSSPRHCRARVPLVICAKGIERDDADFS